MKRKATSYGARPAKRARATRRRFKRKRVYRRAKRMARRRLYKRGNIRRKENYEIECIQMPSWSIGRTTNGTGAAAQVHETVVVAMNQMVSASRRFDEFYFFRPKKFMLRYRNKFDNDGHTAWYYTHRSGVCYDDPMGFINEANAASLSNVRSKLPNARPIPKDKGVIKGIVKSNVQENVEYEGGGTQVIDYYRPALWTPTSTAGTSNVKFYCKSLHLPGVQNLDWEGPEGGILDVDGLNEKPTNQLVQEVVFDLYVIVEFKMSKPKGLIS